MLKFSKDRWRNGVLVEYDYLAVMDCLSDTGSDGRRADTLEVR
jgi:hypothetical protein